MANSYWSRLTGLGLVTLLGCGVETMWKRLIEGGCRIRAPTPDDLKMSSFDRETQLPTFDQLTAKIATVACALWNRPLVNSMRIFGLILRYRWSFPWSSWCCGSNFCNTSRSCANQLLTSLRPDPIFTDDFEPLSSSKEMPTRAALSNSWLWRKNAALVLTSAF